METRAHHVVIGAFALVVLALAAAFALWLGKSALDREWNEYEIVFNEAVTGLTVGGAVQYNGIQVGEVRRLSLDPTDPSKVRAHVRIGTAIPIKVDTRAKLSFTGLTGVALIQLSGGSQAAPILKGDDGRPARIVADTSALQLLLSSSEDIATTASAVLVRINRLLDEENVASVARTLHHLETLAAAAAESESDVRTILAEAADASRRLAELLKGAEAVMSRIDSGFARADVALSRELPILQGRLDASLASLQKLSASAEGILEENRGALADLGQNGLTEVGPTLVELRSLLVDLRRLSARVGDSPAEFLLGRKTLPEFDPR